MLGTATGCWQLSGEVEKMSFNSGTACALVVLQTFVSSRCGFRTSGGEPVLCTKALPTLHAEKYNFKALRRRGGTCAQAWGAWGSDGFHRDTEHRCIPVKPPRPKHMQGPVEGAVCRAAGRLCERGSGESRLPTPEASQNSRRVATTLGKIVIVPIRVRGAIGAIRGRCCLSSAQC